MNNSTNKKSAAYVQGAMLLQIAIVAIIAFAIATAFAATPARKSQSLASDGQRGDLPAEQPADLVEHVITLR